MYASLVCSRIIPRASAATQPQTQKQKPSAIRRGTSRDPTRPRGRREGKGVKGGKRRGRLRRGISSQARR